LKSKALLHIAVFMDVVAALKISANRAVAGNLQGGITSAQNLPLAAVIAAVIFLAEVLSRKKISNLLVAFFFLTAMIFLACSFYLPPAGEASGEPSVLAYAAVMIQFSSIAVISFTKRPNIGKILAGIVFIAGVFTFAGFIYTFTNGETFRPGMKSDAAVVLGASVWGKYKPSPILRGRLETAINIFNSGQAKKIIVTGGTKRFDTIESEVQAWYLRQRGIPDSSIVAEHNTFCTSEQAEYIKDVLVDSLGMKNIVVVTDNWHLPRVLLMCSWEGVTQAGIYGAASSYRLFAANEFYSRLRESAAIQVFLLFGA